MTTQEPESFSPEQGETLIERMERDELDGDDKKRIEKIIRSYLFLASMIQQTGATLSNLRAFLSGRLSKKKRKRLMGKTPKLTPPTPSPSPGHSINPPVTTSESKGNLDIAHPTDMAD